jgi:glycerol kinase
LNTGEHIVHSDHGLLTTVAVKLADRTHYALEGAAFIAGAAVQWLRDGLQIIDHASEIEHWARQAADSGDVVFVPALSGLGAPHWRAEARGLLAGMTRDTGRPEICRAVLEGIALQNRDILESMRKDAGALSVLKVDGGASANNLLMQMQADYLNLGCVRPDVLETTALGAAALAGLAIGMFGHPDEVRKVWREDQRFVPSMDESLRQRHFHKWERAVARA